MESSTLVKNRWMRLFDKALGSSVMDAGQIFALLFPLFLDQVFVRAINLLNTSMISSYGPEAMSAVSMVDSLNNFMVNFFIAISTGCTVVVAQYFGRKDRKMANYTAAQSITSAIGLAVVITALILIFTNPIIAFLFGKGDALFQSYAVIFLRASAISYPFFALIQTGLGAMRGSGNTRVSVFFSTGVNVLNVLLNILFLNIFRFGVVGLSISLITSRLLTAGVMLWYILRSNDEFPLRAKHFFRINMPIQRSVMTVALPTGLEQVFFHGGRILTQIFIVGFGTMSTAANAVGMQYSNFVQLIGATLQVALVTIAGQCIGAGEIPVAKWYIKRITWLATLGTLVLSVLLLLIMPWFLGWFALDPEAYEIAVNLCIMNVIGTPIAWATSFVTPQGLRAAGDARYTSLVAMTTMWTVRVAGGYLLGVVLGYGIYGVWIAMFVEWGARSAFFLARLRGDTWWRHRVIQD